VVKELSKSDVLHVSVIGAPGRWELLLEVNGKEVKRYGPWTDRDTADLYAAEALARAQKLADKLWKDF
jgi:hypothetical protein